MGKVTMELAEASDPERIGRDVEREALKQRASQLLSDEERANRMVRGAGAVTYTPAEVRIVAQAHAAGLLRDRPLFAVQERQDSARCITRFFGGADDAALWAGFTNNSVMIGGFNRTIASRGQSRRWFER